METAIKELGEHYENSMKLDEASKLYNHYENTLG
jgi:hypothetical protein